MWHRNVTRLAVGAAWAILGCVIAAAAENAAADKAELDKALVTLKTYELGEDRAAMRPIDDAVATVYGDEAARKQLETRLVEILKSDAPADAKQYICRKLMIIGSVDSVPALAALLPDKVLSHMARYALERISAPEAAQALRDALPKVDGALNVGVISSLGARRDAASVPVLAALMADTDKATAAAAACALGAIGNPAAAKALGDFAKKAPTDLKPAVTDATLVCAQRLLADREGGLAFEVYNSLDSKEQPSAVRLAAKIGTCRALVASGDKVYDVLIPTIISFLGDHDKKVRAVGLQLVREAVKGPAATKQFAAALPKLTVEDQIALLGALADRGDRTARPAVLDMLSNVVDGVRVPALQALGMLGEAADVPILLHTLTAGPEPEQAAARDSLTRLCGPSINEAIVGEMKTAKPEVRVELIELLANRRAIDTISSLLAAAEDADSSVRMKAMNALGQLAGPEHVSAMLKAVLKAEKGQERDAADTAVMLVCNQTKDPDQRAEPILAALAKLSQDDQTALLPTLGKVGGRDAMSLVAVAMNDSRPERREAGFRALTNWPDGSIAPKLIALAQAAGDDEQRLAIVRALIRVAPLPDKRPDAERLGMLKKAMSLTTRDDDRNLVLKRASAIRTIEALRFVAAYMYHPAYAQQACATVVELAHHRELRVPNEAEFDEALNAVISISKDANLIDEAKRYKTGQT
jgi:HEAT repeat protein